MNPDNRQPDTGTPLPLRLKPRHSGARSARGRGMRGPSDSHNHTRTPQPWHPSVFFPKAQRKAEAAVALAIALSALVHLKLAAVLIGEKSPAERAEEKRRADKQSLEVLPPTFVMANPFANQEKVQTNQEGALNQRAAQEDAVDPQSTQTGPQLQGEDPFYNRIISGRPDATDAAPPPPPPGSGSPAQPSRPASASVALATPATDANAVQQTAVQQTAAQSSQQPVAATTAQQQASQPQQTAQQPAAQQPQQTPAPSAAAEQSERPVLAKAPPPAALPLPADQPQIQSEGLQSAQQPVPGQTASTQPAQIQQTEQTLPSTPAYRPPLTQEANPLPAIAVTERTPQPPQPQQSQTPAQTQQAADTAQQQADQQPPAAQEQTAAAAVAQASAAGQPSNNQQDAAAQDEASPLPRPRLEPRISAGPLRHQAAAANRSGVVAIDSRLSEFGAYQQRMVEAVSAQWYMLLNQSSAAGSQFGTRVELRFRLNDQGVVSRMEVLHTSASAAATMMCINAVESRSPFGVWHEDMKRVLGSEDTINFTFFYR